MSTALLTGLCRNRDPHDPHVWTDTVILLSCPGRVQEQTPTEMPAAEKYAALVALSAGLDAEIAKAKAEALDEVASLRKASWTTPYGTVNMTRSEEKVEILPAAFLAFAREHYPDEIVTTESVRSSFVEAWLRDLVIVGGEVVYKGTGEVVDFARVRPEGEARLSYPASTEQRDAKDLARLLFEDRSATLTAALRELTA